MHSTFQNKKILTLFLLILLAGLAGCDKKKGDVAKAGASAGPAVVGVDVVVLKEQVLEDKITSTGTLLPNEEVELRPEISGRIQGIYFEEGARVKKGQLLVKIDDSELKAQLKRLEIQNELLRDRERRSKVLFGKEGISEEEYQTALNNYKTNLAEIELIRSRIEKTRIVAPYDGVVGLRSVSQGGFVSAENLIARLQQLNPIKLEFSVPEKFASMIKEGTPVQFTIDGIDTVYKASVYAIGSSVDVNTRSIRIRAKGSNPNNKLKPGAFAKAEIIADVIENALLIPSEAVVPELGRQKVFVVRDGKVYSQLIKIGMRTERATQIVEGLRPSDSVVVSGLMSLKDSVKVNVKSVRK